MARPCEYKDEYVEKAKEYLEQCQDEEYQLTKSSGGNVETWENKIKVKLPTIEGFSRFLGVAVSSLYEWEKKFPEFSKALGEIKTEQKERLLDKGLSGHYNSTIAKLILSSNHGMTERQDVTTKGREMPTPILNGLSGNNSNKENSSSE